MSTNPEGAPPLYPTEEIIPADISRALAGEALFQADLIDGSTQTLRQMIPTTAEAAGLGGVAGLAGTVSAISSMEGRVVVGVIGMAALFTCVGTRLKARHGARAHADGERSVGENYELYTVGVGGERHRRERVDRRLFGLNLGSSTMKVTNPNAYVMRWDGEGENLPQRLAVMVARAGRSGIHQLAVSKATVEAVLPESKNWSPTKWSEWLGRGTGLKLEATNAAADEVIVKSPINWMIDLADRWQRPEQRRVTDTLVEKLEKLQPTHPLVQTYRAFAESPEVQGTETTRVAAELLQFVGLHDTEPVSQRHKLRWWDAQGPRPDAPAPNNTQAEAASEGRRRRAPEISRYERQPITGTLSEDGKSVRWRGADRSWLRSAAESLGLREGDMELLAQQPDINPRAAEKVLTLLIFQQLKSNPGKLVDGPLTASSEPGRLAWPTRNGVLPRAAALAEDKPPSISLRRQRKRQLAAAALVGTALFAGLGTAVNVIEALYSSPNLALPGSTIGDVGSSPNVREWRLHPKDMNPRGYWTQDVFSHLEGDTWLKGDQLLHIESEVQLPTAPSASLKQYIEVEKFGPETAGYSIDRKTYYIEIPVLLGAVPVAAVIDGAPVTRIQLDDGTYGFNLQPDQVKHVGNLKYWVASDEGVGLPDVPHAVEDITVGGIPYDPEAIAATWQQTVPGLARHNGDRSLRAKEEAIYVRDKFDYSLTPLDGEQPQDYKTWSGVLRHMVAERKDDCNLVSNMIALDNPASVNIATGYLNGAGDDLSSHNTHQWTVTKSGTVIDGTSQRVSAKDQAYFTQPLVDVGDSVSERAPIPWKGVALTLDLVATGFATYGSWTARHSIGRLYSEIGIAAAATDQLHRRRSLDKTSQQELAMADLVVGQVLYGDPSRRLNGVRLANQVRKNETPAGELAQKLIDREDLRDPAVIVRLQQLEQTGGLTPVVKASVQTTIRVLQRAHQARGSQSFREGDVAKATV